MLAIPEQAGKLSYAQTELIHVIRRCGLTSGLKLCLDAGDAASYTSGQKWLDVSGNGFDFFRGVDGTAAADDPTFNGTPGRRTSGEYWSFDGGDFFRYDAVNEAWMNNLHKDNAKFTLVTWGYFPSYTGVLRGICGTTGGAAVPGFHWLWVDGDRYQFEVLTSGGSVLLFYSSAVGLAINTWHFVAVSLDEAVGADGAITYIDGTAGTTSSTYTSPSAAGAQYTFEIGASGNAASPLLNTTRLGMFAAWEGVALTTAQLHALFQGTRGRFGI